MTTLARSLVVAEMQGRELLRRRVVVSLLVLLPAAFYFSTPANEDYGVLSGSIGVCWAVAAAGLFGLLGWRRADPRLALAGATPREGLLGRLLVLVGLAAALTGVFAPLILVRSSQIIQQPARLVTGLAMLALVSVPLGLAIGALVPRELEGTLVLIGLVGVAMSIPPDLALAGALPLYGPLKTLEGALEPVGGAGLAGPVMHTTVSAAGLVSLAAWRWNRRVRVARPAAWPRA